MAVEERHSQSTAGDGIAVAREEGDGSSLDLERVLDTNEGSGAGAPDAGRVTAGLARIEPA